MGRDLREQLEEACRATGVVGASLGILTPDDRIVVTAGLADVDAGLAVDAATPFQIASVTKPMVATVIARLVERRALALDDPIAEHVPEVADAAWGSRVEIHHLLSQTHAIAPTTDLEFDMEHDADDALAALASALATCPTMAPPGVLWSYSNCGANLLGRAIETACGSTWEDAMRAELFEPLGMVHTGFVHEGAAASVRGGYRVTETWTEASGVPPALTWEPAEPWTSRPLGPSGTTVWSTAEDLLRFARLHLDRDAGVGTEARSLGWLRRTTARVRVPDFLDAWCSMMARRDMGGAPAYGWSGVATGHRAFWAFVPEKDLAVVVLTNTSTGRRLFRRVLPEVLRPYGLKPEPLDLTPRPGAAGDLGRFTGVYRWGHDVIEVTADGEELVFTRPEDGTVTRGTPIDDLVFLVDPSDPDFPTIAFGDVDVGRPGMLYPGPWGLRRVELATA